MMAKQETVLNPAILREVLREAPCFKKKAKIWAYQASGITEIKTALRYGQPGETQIAKDGDFVAINPGGDKSVIPQSNMFNLYKPAGPVQEVEGKMLLEFEPVGLVRAIPNPEEGPVTLPSPWDASQDMHGSATDRIVLNEATQEMFLVDADEFEETFVQI